MRAGSLLLACLVAAGLAAASARAGTVFVVKGRGWGHGIGMSQWGAYGYAKHGWSYPRILAHYFPGTRLGRTDVRSVRVLLAERRPSLAVGCAGPIRVTDRAGRVHRLPAGRYRLGRRLRLPVETIRLRRSRATHRLQRALVSPLTFDCPSAPLELGGRAYHGTFVVHRQARRLSVVNVVPLEEYLRGVVGGEMPHRWNLAALEAQAVAARSYALATLKPRAAFDLYADTRSQVYGGLAYESHKVDLAVERTAGRVLLWKGRVATTLFFSTSGGRTAAIRDVWPRAAAVPYLRSVPDPYDVASPHHVWGPIVLTSATLATRLRAPALRRAGSLRVITNESGRAADVVADKRLLAARQVQIRLGLRSTWFRIGQLTLAAGRGRLVFGGTAVLCGRAVGLGRVELQRRTASGRWRHVRTLRPGSFAVRVQPRGSTVYRLAGEGARGLPVSVSVAPRLRAEARDRGRVLVGTVRPRSEGRLAVSRWTPRGWRVVAHPLLDRRGVFHVPLRLQSGGYRITVAAAGELVGATTHLRLTPRLLASR
jgi:stage II sporulation protein D